MQPMSRREFAKAGGASVFAMMIASEASWAASSDAIRRDPLALVDKELRPAAQRFIRADHKYASMSNASLPQWRSMAATFARPALENVPYATRRISGTAGAPDVTLYIVNAKPGTARPAILHTHGGGFVMGAARYDIRNLQEVAMDLDCVIVSVDYRLAPETHYVGSIEDNYAGLKWVYTHAAEIGVDPRRIALMGESAGGGHAALLAIVARDRGEVPILFQCLIYPMLDDRTGSTRRVPDHIGTLVWNTEANRYGWGSFLRQQPGTRSVPSGAVPARTPDLRGLPATFIGVGSIDLFVQEDIDYARRLIESGTRTELLVVPGAFHGFDGIAPETQIARRFTTAKLQALRRAFEATT